MNVFVHRGLAVAVDSSVSVQPIRWFWRVAGLPVLLLLKILEPLVTFVLAALALLGLLTTVFFYFVGPPQFPVWTMLALSLAFAVVLLVYHALVRFLSNI